MKTNYDVIKGIFIQNSFSRTFLENKLKERGLNATFLNIADMEFLCWRYVFMSDISKGTLTKKFLKFGFDNLTVIEIINGLVCARKAVVQILKDTKE